MNKKKIFATKVHTCPLEAVREEVYKSHTLEACAQATGKSHVTLSKQLNDDGTHLSLLTAAAICDFLDSDALAESSAARRGGIFVRLPKADEQGTTELGAEYSLFVREFSEASLAFSEMVGDNKIEAHEVDKFEREAREMWAQTERVIRLARSRVRTSE